MRVAIIDVGSNSVRLLVADISDGQVFSVMTRRITSRLLSGFDGHMLSPQSLERTGDAIEEFVITARTNGANHIEAFGTSAMRDGLNRDALIQRARFIGIPLRVLSGEEEAVLAYAGVAPEGKCAVLDIGGGSTEWLIGENGNVLQAHSMQIGAVRLFEAIGAIDMPRMKEMALAALSPAWTSAKAFPVDRVMGVGGTLTTLGALALNLSPYDPNVIEGYSLKASVAAQWFDRLCALSLDQRKMLPGLTPERADIIPFGSAIACAFFTLSGQSAMTLSDRDNLIGYIRKFFLKTP